MPKQGDIVLIPVPFTDLTSSKRRPVIVVSNDDYNQSVDDIVVVAMTSSPQAATYCFAIDNEDLEQGALNRPTFVRADKVYTLSHKLVVRVFGTVKKSVLERIRAQWLSLTATA